MYIDTHTHLFAEQFDEDRDFVIQQAIHQGVDRFFLPNIDLGSIHSMLELGKNYKENCFPMIGLHPCSVKADYKEVLQLIEEIIEKEIQNCHGIGETGLDYYWDKTFIEEQQDSLRIHADWAKNFNLPIILHTRDSFEDNIRIMQEEQDGNLRGIFHCFSGTLEQAKQVIDLGFLLGIGGVVTFKNSGKGLRETLSEISMNHIVLETDSPYLAPHPNRGKRNESSYIPLIAQTIADVKEISIEEVAKLTTENAEKLFGKKS